MVVLARLNSGPEFVEILSQPEWEVKSNGLVPVGSTTVQPLLKLDAENSSLNPALAEAKPTLNASVKKHANRIARIAIARFLI
jgi:hypothetical protein